MSNDVFPALPGLMWGTTRTPIWATKVLTASSGRELRASFQSYPRYRYLMKYEFLRERGGHAELQSLLGFFNQMGGSLDSFLFQDDSDYTATDQALGVGDGTTSEFRLVREYGGFVEPVLAPNDIWMYLDRGVALGKWRVANVSRTNHFARTEDLSNSYWTKVGTTITVNATTAPDGAAVADLVTEDTSTGEHSVYHSFVPPGGAGAKHVISFYLKANGRLSSIKSLWDGGGECQFNLTANTATPLGAGELSGGLVELSGGWHRVWVVVRPTSTDAHSLRLKLWSNTTTDSYTGGGTAGVYATWPQCEVLAEDAPEEPTEYIPSVGSAATTVTPAFAMSDHGYFDFATSPPSGVLISWSGTFYWRCRFTHDAADFEQFMRDLFTAKKIEFMSIK